MEVAPKGKELKYLAQLYQAIRIEVNGVVTTDIDDSAHSSGVIGLQHHGETGAVYRFRNLRVRPGVPPVTSSPEE